MENVFAVRPFLLYHRSGFHFPQPFFEGPPQKRAALKPWVVTSAISTAALITFCSQSRCPLKLPGGIPPLRQGLRPQRRRRFARGDLERVACERLRKRACEKGTHHFCAPWFHSANQKETHWFFEMPMLFSALLLSLSPQRLPCSANRKRRIDLSVPRCWSRVSVLWSSGIGVFHLPRRSRV